MAKPAKQAPEKKTKKETAETATDVRSLRAYVAWVGAERRYLSHGPDDVRRVRGARRTSLR